MIVAIVQIEVGEKAFEFDSFSRWVNKAQGWFLQRGLTSKDVVCLDAKGRICRIGADFMRARDDDSFPVAVYHITPTQSA